MSNISITSLQQLQELQANSLVIKISTPTCGPCKMMAPIFESLSEEDDTSTYGSVELGANAEVELLTYVKQTLKVSAVPTFVSFKNGEVVQKFSGSFKKEDLKSKLQSV